MAKHIQMNRREFLSAGAAVAAVGPIGCVSQLCVGRPLPPHREGELDIHFIHTGVGEQTFFVFPDGGGLILRKI